jgi:ATP-binding cassette subfamily G (WHITE) protein 2 (SNQ2)
MAMEFTGLMFDCDSSRRVPRGSSYDGVPVSCAIPGAATSQDFVDGKQYLDTYYSFTQGHVWRNCGILLGMSLGYIVLTVFLLEYLDWSNGASGAGGVEYITGSKQQRADTKDTESQIGSGPSLRDDAPEKADIPPTIATDSTFTWENITYTIPYGKSEKTLLNSVSGFCRPGEMTALVGASGAGKSTREYNCILWDTF